MILFNGTKCKIRFIYICTKDSIAKEKSGVKFVWKFVHGGGRRLMANAILNFHFFGTFP